MDRNSLKELKTFKTVPPTEDNPGPLNPMNIGLICGSVTVVIIVVTIIGYYCYKTSTRRQTHTELGDARPADETCSRREKYEMTEVPSKGDNPLCFEEKGISNQGME